MLIEKERLFVFANVILRMSQEQYTPTYLETRLFRLLKQTPLRLYRGAQIGLQHRCKDWGRVSLGGGGKGKSDFGEGAVGCLGWALMTAEGLRLSLACPHGDRVRESRGAGVDGGRRRVEEFMQFLRHQALSWWWGRACDTGTGRHI